MVNLSKMTMILVQIYFWYPKDSFEFFFLMRELGNFFMWEGGRTIQSSYVLKLRLINQWTNCAGMPHQTDGRLGYTVCWAFTYQNQIAHDRS